MINTTAANPTPCGANPGAQWLEYSATAGRSTYRRHQSGIRVLAGNLGTQGCGFEHQLQAFEFALTNLWPGQYRSASHAAPHGLPRLGLPQRRGRLFSRDQRRYVSSLLNTTLAMNRPACAARREHTVRRNQPRKLPDHPPPGLSHHRSLHPRVSDCSARTGLHVPITWTAIIS